MANKEDITVLIEKDCTFEGRLAFEGTARIAGDLKGEIISPDNLIIEKSAYVDAYIEASEIHIYGKVVGKIVAKGQVRLAEESIFHGDVISPSLHISEGADFQGRSIKPQSEG